MRYATAGALRAAIDQRLVQQSTESGVDIARLRRRVVFERLLVRFAAGQAWEQTSGRSTEGIPGKGGVWVLKGGAALEFRLADRARATKDVDVEMRHGELGHEEIRGLFVETLLVDPDGDFFTFRLDSFGPITVGNAPGPILRSKLDCRLDGRTFDRITVDMTMDEAAHHRIEPLRLPGLLGFADLSPATILAVDLDRHFAEKLHAMVRDYGGRPSSRVKDLADLVLLIDMGLEPTAELHAAATEVFAARDGTSAPSDIPDPPSTWAARFGELADELNLSAPAIGAAMDALRSFWSRALTTPKEN